MHWILDHIMHSYTCRCLKCESSWEFLPSSCLFSPFSRSISSFSFSTSTFSWPVCLFSWLFSCWVVTSAVLVPVQDFYIMNGIWIILLTYIYGLTLMITKSGKMYIDSKIILHITHECWWEVRPHIGQVNISAYFWCRTDFDNHAIFLNEGNGWEKQHLSNLKKTITSICAPNPAM